MKKLLLLLWTLPCFAAVLPLDPSISIGELNNGISYYVCEQPASDRVTLRLVVPVGSVFEREGEEGIAHFVEHMVFRGTENFTEAEIQEFLQEGGADGNAYTSFDETVYELDVPVEELEEGLALMADWASCATLLEEAIEAERGIVLEEWRLHRGPMERVGEEAMALMMAGSPYAERMPIGLESVIRGADEGVIRGFYERCYTGAPISVVAVGDVPTRKLKRMIRETFGRLPAVREREGAHAFESSQERLLQVVRDVGVATAQLELLFRRSGAPVETEEALREQLVAELFHSLMGARLREVSGRANLGSGIDCEAFNLVRGLEIDEISTQCSPEAAHVVLASLVAELRRVQANGFGEAEFGRATRMMQEASGIHDRGRVWRSRSEIARACVRHFLLGATLMTPEDQGRLCSELVRAITPAEVQAYARALDLEMGCIIHVVVPQDWRGEDQLEEALEIAMGSPLVPYVERELPTVLMEEKPLPGEVVGGAGVAPIDLTTLHFANGATVHLMTTFSGDGEVLLNATALGGLSEFGREQLAAAKLAAPLLNASGVAGYSPVELERILAGKEASLHTFIAPYTRSVMGSAGVEGMESMLQMLHLGFLGVDPNPAAFEGIKQGWIAALKQVEANPEAYFERQLEQIHHVGSDFFQLPTIEEVEEASFAYAAAVGRLAFCNPADFTFCLVGDFDLWEAKRLAEVYIGSLPTMEEQWNTYTELDDRFPHGVSSVTLFKGCEPRSVVQLTFPVGLRVPTPELLELMDACGEVACQRVYNLLRERLSSTYHVECNLEFLWPSTKHGLFSVRFGCDPQDAALLAAMAVRELRILCERGPTANEVADVLDQVQWKSLGIDEAFWVNELGRYAQMQWDPISLARLNRRSDIVSRESVHQALQSMLRINNYSQVILYPEHSPEQH